jgi:lipoate-protein ligase A
LCERFSQNCEIYNFNEDDLFNINKLVKEKYSTYEWNIGRSPKGSIKFAEKFNFGIVELCFDLLDGVMNNVNISGDFFSISDISTLAQNLNGVKFDRENLLDAFKDIDKYIQGANATDIVDKLF